MTQFLVRSPHPTLGLNIDKCIRRGHCGIKREYPAGKGKEKTAVVKTAIKGEGNGSNRIRNDMETTRLKNLC